MLRKLVLSRIWSKGNGRKYQRKRDGNDESDYFVDLLENICMQIVTPEKSNLVLVHGKIIENLHGILKFGQMLNKEL